MALGFTVSYSQNLPVQDLCAEGIIGEVFQVSGEGCSAAAAAVSDGRLLAARGLPSQPC